MNRLPPVLQTTHSLQEGKSILDARSLFILLFIFTGIVMGRVAVHEFVDLDDRLLIADNPKFNPPTWSAVLGFVLPRNLDENLYIPVTEIAWGALAAIGRTDHADAAGSLLNPWVFHSASLMLHVASAGIVFAILRHFFVDAIAWIAAITFSIHPVQVETIAWATGLRDLLAALFGFICFLQLIRYRQNKRRRNWIIATVMVALAMLSKPSAVALPLEALVLDVILLGTNWRKSLACLLPWFIFAIPIVLVTRHVQPIVWPIHNPPICRPIVALDAIAFYITKLVVPVGLAIDYGRTPPAIISGGVRAIWMIPLAMGALLALGALLAGKGKRYTLIVGGCLLAIAGVLPVLGLISFEAQDYSTVSDRYLYPSMLGIAIVVAVMIETGIEKIGRSVVYTLASVLIAAMAWQSFAAMAVWSNSYTLFTQALRINPRSSNANTGLGCALAASGDLPGAIECFRRAEQFNPHNGMATENLANLLLHEGDLDGAAEQYARLIDIYGMQPNFDPKLGAAGELVIASRLIKRGNAPAAIAALQRAKTWTPLDPRIDEMLARASASTQTATGAHAAN